MQKRCSATKADGAQCGGVPYKGGDLCWFHSPHTAADRAAGRRLGGAAKSNRSRARRQLMNAALSPAEIGGLLSVTLTNVIGGKVEPGVANAAANLARAIVAVKEASEVEERIAALEAALEQGGRGFA